MVEDFKGEFGQWMKCSTVDGVKHLTKSYSVWNSMRNRCKEGGTFQTKFPSYAGCKMSAMFGNFQKFTDWHREQIGFGIYGYALDKDLLDKGAKLYSEDTCVLVPRDLNSFYTPQMRRKGGLPTGVYEVNGKYRASISKEGRLTYVGCYSTPEEASEAYLAEKRVEARRWADRLEAGEFVVDPRVVAALRSLVLIEDYYKPKKEKA